MNDLEKRLLEGFQRDFPLSPRPFAEIAGKLGIGEDEVIAVLESLQESGAVSRVGCVFSPGGVGVSTLAAMEVPTDRLDEVAELVNNFEAVNHNYEREHALNLWFVITAPDDEELARTITEIERQSGLKVLDLPMVEGYHLDLGFDLKWN